MFCLDYVLAFVFHSVFTVGAVHLSTEWIRNNGGGASWLSVQEDHVDLALWTAVTALGFQSQIASKHHALDDARSLTRSWERNLVPGAVGLTAGSAASLTLYPFDFVREGVITGGLRQRIVSAASTAPYAGALFGVYFSQRDPNRISSQMGWGVAAASCAALAEAPFDYAKKAMFSSRMTMIGANMLYVPFAALMLVMYDKATAKIMTQYLDKTEGK